MKGKGGHVKNDERVAQPPTGSLDGNVMEHKWILTEDIGNMKGLLHNIVEMKKEYPPNLPQNGLYAPENVEI